MDLAEVARCPTKLDSGVDFKRHRGVSPVVFTDFVSAHDWRAGERWTHVEYLQGMLADIMTPVQSVQGDCGSDTSAFDPSKASGESLMSWDTAVGAIFDAESDSTSRLYLKGGMKAELLRDVQPVPSSVFGFSGVGRDALNMGLAKVWIGSKGNVTPLHFDMCHGCLIQIKGAKDVVLFPSSASSALYPYPTHLGAPRTSRLDLTRFLRGCPTTARRYPLARHATGGLRCRVQPGEALYIPPFWWHHVTAAEHNVSVLMPFDLSSEEQRAADRPWTAPDWGAAAESEA